MLVLAVVAFMILSALTPDGWWAVPWIIGITAICGLAAAA